MQTTITVRHSEIPDALRARTLEVLDRLALLAPRPTEATVVFDVEGVMRTVEIRLAVPRGEVLVARGEAEDHRTALDRAEARLRRQAVRATDRPRQSRPMPAAET